MPDTKLLPGLPVVNADVTIGSGDGFFPKVEEISTADQTSVIGDGTTQRPLHSTGGGGGTPSAVGIQSYRYVATGGENPAGFPIPLQTARTDALYNAAVELADTTEDYTAECPPSGYTNTQFTCVPGTTPTVGDILLITITPLT